MYKRISVVELYSHHEVVRTLCKLFGALHYQVELYTNREVWGNCYDLQNLGWITVHLQRRGETKSEFIQQHLHDINVGQLVIFTTLVDELKAFSSIKFTLPSVLIIHNGHTFFDPFGKIVISRNWKEIGVDLMRLLFQLIYLIPVWRKQLLRSASFLSFSSDRILAYLEDNYPHRLQNFSILPAFPFAYFEGAASVEGKDANSITISIPGTVNYDGKDYDSVVKAFSLLSNKRKKTLKLVLLGDASADYGRKITQDLKGLFRKGLEIISFNGPVSQNKFDDIMRQTDFLILPIRPYLKLGICQERYGYSNISGGINDMIRFGLPALIPKSYPLHNGLADLSCQYKDGTELSQLLEYWIDEMGYLPLRKKADQILSEYSKEAMQRRTSVILNTVLNLHLK